MKMEKCYKIKKAKRENEDYCTMIIIDRSTCEKVAEYRLTAGHEAAEIASMRRAIDRHIENGGGLGNYQW